MTTVSANQKTSAFFSGEFMTSWVVFWPQACASSSTNRFGTCLSVSLVSKLSLTDLPVSLWPVCLSDMFCMDHTVLVWTWCWKDVCLSLPCIYDLSVSQICPALNHAALVHVNSMLETIPVRSEVDQFIGIDYSLIDDPVVTSRSLDMHFRVRLRFQDTVWRHATCVSVMWTQIMLCLQGMFFALSHQNHTLVNYAVDPVIREYDRMVYLALSEFFFDSGMFAYYTAGIFQMDIVNEKVKKQTAT